MTKRTILEKDGHRATISALVLFAYVKQGSNQPRKLDATIDVYDKASKVGTISISASPSHNGYNCIHAPLDQRLTATHCYLKINAISGITELSDIYAVYGISANT